MKDEIDHKFKAFVDAELSKLRQGANADFRATTEAEELSFQAELQTLYEHGKKVVATLQPEIYETSRLYHAEFDKAFTSPDDLTRMWLKGFGHVVAPQCLKYQPIVDFVVTIYSKVAGESLKQKT